VGEAVAVNTTANRYRADELAVLVPTFKRPAKLRNLLESLAAQSTPAGRVIIVDGDTTAEPVVNEFADSARAEYFRCVPPGQLRQRRHGIAQLKPTDRLVALLDDDIVLEPEAIAEMIAFWNRSEPTTAGVCFNIINGEPERFSVWHRLLGLGASQPGRVLSSGLTTANSHVSADARVQWLPGGATVWRSDVLARSSHVDVAARWAIAEDLIFSYPIGKSEPLYVSALARVRHEHVADYGVQRQDRYHGRTQTLWTYHFVSRNSDLSLARFLLATVVRMAGKFVGRGILRRDPSSREFVIGQASALASIAANAMRGGDSTSLLSERPASAAPAASPPNR
jgi:glycosyltransferase involved in cell wall biosynthesis